MGNRSYALNANEPAEVMDCGLAARAESHTTRALAEEPLRGLRALQVVGGSKFGGAVHVIHHCSQVLRQAGAEVAIEASDPQVVEFFQNRRFKVYSGLPWAREISPLKDTRYFAGLLWLLRRSRFDIVHTHLAKANFVGRLAARAAGTPIVVAHCHNLYYAKGLAKASRFFYKLLEKVAGNFQDCAIFPDTELCQIAVADRIIRRERAVAIPNAVHWLGEPLEKGERLRMRSRLGLPPESLAVCFTGRLVPQKGVHVLLEAWAKVARRDARLCLLVVGEGPERARLEKLAARLGIHSSVAFLGFRDDVHKLLVASDVFAFPSFWEGQPVAVLEAMATGLPILATEIRGIRGTLRDGKEGLLVAPGDPVAFAGALERVTENPELRIQLGRAARRRAEELFDPARVARQLRDVYCRLVAEKRGAEPRTRLGAEV